MAEFLAAKSALSAVRAVRDWLRSCPDLPHGLTLTFEDLPENDVGICLSTEQAPAYAARYITGGYRAQYDFRVIYRVLPSDDGDMLAAVEALTDVCAWCETTAPPDLEDAINEKITRTSDVAVIAVDEDGTNDYSASLTLTWEVF